MRRFDFSIKFALILLVAICIVPAALGAISLFALDYSRAKETRIDSSVTTARAIVYAVDKEFSSIESTLRALATSPSLTRGDVRAFYQQAQDTHDGSLVGALVLSTPSGKQIFNSKHVFGKQLATITDTTHLRLLDDTDGPIITSLVQESVSNEPVFIISVPVKREGRHLYNLSAYISPGNFARLLKQQQLPPEWIIAIVDSQGTIVARTHEMTRFSGKTAAPVLKEAMQFDNEGWFEGKTSEGIEVLGIFSRSAVSNWAVAIGIPSASIATELREKLGWLALGMAVLLATSFVAAGVISSKIAKSVGALRAPALALGQGKEVWIPKLRLKESKELASALKQASLMLNAAQHQATHDVLTGLPNRTLFNDLVKKHIAASKRSNAHFSVLYIDLDGFKPVNDIHGHATGDGLLCEVARRLTAALRESDMAARLGGDEFAVLLVGTPEKAARKVADTLVSILSAPYDLDGTVVRISASIGVAGFPEAGTEDHELLQKADRAMYYAKEAGKGQTRCATE